MEEAEPEHSMDAAAQQNRLSLLFMKYGSDLEGIPEEIIDSLPKAIRSTILHYYSLLNQVYLFKRVSNHLFFQLATEMKVEYFPPKEDVILQNEAPTDFYIFLTGAAELIMQKNGSEHVIGEIQSGDVVGEIGVLCSRPHLFTVRTKWKSQILRLTSTTFLNLANSNVGDGAIIMNNFLQHLQASKYEEMKVVFAETKNMLAKGKMVLPNQTCFALYRNDDLLLHKMLNKGSDPNEVDINGQPALHIAVSKGSTHCVTLLLENGADPKSKDLDGNVPLFNAIMGGHESIAKLLINNGAVTSDIDVGNLACSAVKKSDLKLLKQLTNYYNLDVTKADEHGTTALLLAVSMEKIEIVKFLVDRGADPYERNDIGWYPRLLARKRSKCNELLNILPSRQPDEHVACWKSTYSTCNCLLCKDFKAKKYSLKDKKDSLKDKKDSFLPRVTISCPEKVDHAKKLVLLPKSIEELLEIGAKKFDISPTKILNREGAEIDDINVIRDGDHLIIAHNTEEDGKNKLPTDGSSLEELWALVTT